MIVIQEGAERYALACIRHQERTMNEFYFGTGLFDEVERLQRQVAHAFNGRPSSIRSDRAGAFPSVNVGSTDDAVEIIAFVPGVDPAQIDVSIEKGLLTISGERKPTPSDTTPEPRAYAHERFTGSFRRVVELPQNVNPDDVQARYVDGCLSIRVAKREASKPRSIQIQ
jgi:HSP20 family protein